MWLLKSSYGLLNERFGVAGFMYNFLKRARSALFKKLYPDSAALKIFVTRLIGCCWTIAMNFILAGSQSERAKIKFIAGLKMLMFPIVSNRVSINYLLFSLFLIAELAQL